MAEAGLVVCDICKIRRPEEAVAVRGYTLCCIDKAVCLSSLLVTGPRIRKEKRWAEDEEIRPRSRKPRHLNFMYPLAPGLCSLSRAADYLPGERHSVLPSLTDPPGANGDNENGDVADQDTATAEQDCIDTLGGDRANRGSEGSGPGDAIRCDCCKRWRSSAQIRTASNGYACDDREACRAALLTDEPRRRLPNVRLIDQSKPFKCRRTRAPSEPVAAAPLTREQIAAATSRLSAASSMTVCCASDFSGIGGFEHGLQAGFAQAGYALKVLQTSELSTSREGQHAAKVLQVR